MVRWQAADALVIERASKAIIGVNDQFSLWQNLVGVQTSWPDGTILVDYSGANTQTITVYGGGKIDFNIPPCNGTAGQGRKGYCIWGPQGITQNYWRPAKRITQEWEMDQDLGDRHINSLQQGGKTPDNSFECRLVGRFFAKNGHIVQIDIYPGTGINALNMDVLDKNCQPVSSVHGVGNLNLSFTPTEEGWYNIRIRNGLGNTPGQKAWVKVNYMGGDSLNSNVPKSNCSCLGSGNVTLNYKYANSSLTPISQSSSQLSINQTVIRRDTIASGGVTNLQSIAANVYNLSMTTSLSWNGVTSTDALLITRAFANLFSLSEIQKLSADVNQSLSVNASDALLITRRFTGIINSFPSGDWVIYPNRISVITGQNNTQEIKVLNSGDVNGSRVGW